MKNTVGFLPRALAEVGDALRWYGRRSSISRARLLRELERAVTAIAEAPAMFPQYEAGTRRHLLRRFPFQLIYRITEDDRVLVVAFAHVRRKPGYWSPSE